MDRWIVVSRFVACLLWVDKRLWLGNSLTEWMIDCSRGGTPSSMHIYVLGRLFVSYFQKKTGNFTKQEYREVKRSWMNQSISRKIFVHKSPFRSPIFTKKAESETQFCLGFNTYVSQKNFSVYGSPNRQMNEYKAGGLWREGFINNEFRGYLEAWASGMTKAYYLIFGTVGSEDIYRGRKMSQFDCLRRGKFNQTERDQITFTLPGHPAFSTTDGDKHKWLGLHRCEMDMGPCEAASRCCTME